VGGLERQWSTLIPGLVERGVEAHVVTLDGEGHFFHELASRGIPAECLELHGRLNVVGAYRAAGALASRRPDVVLSAGVSAHVVGQLTSSRASCAHVAAIHAIPEHPDTFTRRRRFIVRLLSRRVSASTAVTSAQLPFLRSLGFDPAKTVVIPNGLDAVEPVSARAVVRAELGLDDDQFVALLLATLRPEKRADLFVEAVVEANHAGASVRGIVAGGGPELEQLERLCAETDSVVRALGPRSDVPELIEAADVVCLTSDAEALPMAVLEAMAGGRPVVATDVGGVRDAVVDGETGFLVPRRDLARLAHALQRLAADPGLRESLGTAGRKRHRARFTLDRMVDAHYELLQHVSR
jgi:glycosyltransferase involved in cell wall biosynthesis